MKELELEAEKANGYNLYAKDTKGQAFNEGYIAGATTSKYVEKQKLEFAIEQLREFKEHYQEKIGTGKIWNRIQKLEQQLKYLEKETK